MGGGVDQSLSQLETGKADQQDLATLKTRVDNLTANPGESTEGNAELLDMRVGADGLTYPTAGDAMRSQFDFLLEDFLAPLNNVISDFVWTDQKYISMSNGALLDYGTADTYYASDYVPLAFSGKAVIISTKSSSESDKSGGAFYNSSKAVISAFNYTKSAHSQYWITEVEIPENAAYLRITYWNSKGKDDTNINGCKIIQGDLKKIAETLNELTNLTSLLDTSTVRGFGVIQSPTKVTWNDLDNAPANSLYAFGYVPHEDFLNCPPYTGMFSLFTLSTDSKSRVATGGTVQLAVYHSISAVYIRISWASPARYSGWKKIMLESDVNAAIESKIAEINSRIELELTPSTYINYSDGGVRSFSNDTLSTSNYVELLAGEHLRFFYGANGVTVADARGLAFYDKNKAFISGLQYPVGNNWIEMDAPANCRYVRFTIAKNNQDSYSVQIDSPASREVDINYLLNRDSYNPGLNLIPKTYISYKTGNQTTFDRTDLNSTDFIVAPPKSEVIIENYSTTTVEDQRGLAFYDINKNFVSGQQYTADRGSNPKLVLTAPDNACYVRFTIEEAAKANTKIRVSYQKENLIKFLIGDKQISDGSPLATINQTAGMLEVFFNVGCIGDSLASGECYYKKPDGTYTGIDLYQFSWGQFLARMTGNKYYNWSRGGLRTDTWLASSYATECYDGEHKCEAYMIGLAQNDANQINRESLDPVAYVGTIDDINTEDYNQNADTFYGRYAKIIQKIQEIQPKAKIFVMTDPLQYVENYGLNTAIRNIANLFKNVYLMDLYTYGADMYTSGYIAANKRGGHYNAVGYRQMALIMATYIDWIMRNNPQEFLEVEFIGTDYSYYD